MPTPTCARIHAAAVEATLREQWNGLETGEAERTLVGHEGSVYGVAITPDGRRALSASSDRTLKLWNLETGEEMASTALEAGMTCVVVVPPRTTDANAPTDEITVVAGDAAGNVYCLAVVEPRAEKKL